MQKTTGNSGCLIVRNNLFSYQEKQLPGRELMEFKDHLLSCGECSRAFADFQEAMSVIDLKRSDTFNPFIATRTIRRIEAEFERENKGTATFFRRILQPVMVSIILLFAVMIGFSIGRKIDAKNSGQQTRQNNIQAMKSDLYITAFMDESDTYPGNQ